MGGKKKLANGIIEILAVLFDYVSGQVLYINEWGRL